MSKTTNSAGKSSTDRSALRRRIKSFYLHLNHHAFDKCWSFLDPDLRQRGRFEEDKYAKSLSEFLDHYGTIEIVVIKIDLYSGAKVKGQTQDCAYPLVVWKDARHVPHLFRERWVKDGKTWYTRVAGLVTPDANGQEEQQRQKQARHHRRVDR
jgi:hypothetical protein